MNSIVKLILELADQQINIFLEDGKLKIDAPSGIALDAVISRIKAHKDEIIEYLSGNKSVVEISPATLSESYVLSSSQRRLWVLNQLEDGSTAYNIPAVFEFDGMLDMGALSGAFETLIERHESLRTVFRMAADGSIRQYILPAAASAFKIGYHDLTRKDQATIRKVIQTSLFQPFDLGTGPLLRADLYQTGAGKWLFSYVMHHIISDGWSMEVLIKELLQLYHAYVQGRYSPLSPLGIHYKDYAVWQQEQLRSADNNQHKNYWLQQLSGELPVLELPADKPRPVIKTHNGASIHKQLDAGITAGLRALCQSSDSTLFMGLLAAVKVLLYRYTSQEDIIIGSPVAGREHSNLEDQIGFYVNTLALRTQFSGADSYQQLLSRVKQITLDAYEHQSYPFDTLVEELDLQRDLSRSALFDVMLVLQHQSSSALVEKGLPGLQIKTYESLQQAAKFDLQFSFVETGDQLELHLNYNTDIYYKGTIERLTQHLEQLLSAIIAAPEQPIASLAYLSASEQVQLLETFNDTATLYALDKTVVDLFEAQVLRTPDHTALLYEEKTLSYRELNEAANRLAQYLKQAYSISPDDLIGIKQERNEHLIISLLGVLKSGAAYVPIDPDYPQERIDYIVADSKCKVVLDEAELNRFLAKADTYSPANPATTIRPADLAYIIYTSGSTGRPKGVMITHSNVAAFMDWCKQEFSASSYEVVLGVTSICFDLSIFEIFYTLVSGKQLRLLPNALSIPQYLDSSLPLLVNTVPSVVSSLLSTGADLGRVHVLNMAGEPIPVSTVRQLDCNRIELRNLYGPSEDTTYSTIYRLRNDDKVLIGRPVSNTRIYILNDHHQLQPVGVAGEICISGAGLARGYLNQPELTGEKFVPHPFIAGERLYKTGDLGKWQPDGNIAFLGRKDDQVKIRGYRIELGEITQALQDYAGISAAVVSAVKDSNDDNMLVAYVVSTSTLDITALRTWLGARLPHFMQPAHFIQLNALPLLPNGKLNKKALPLPDGQASGKKYVAPSNRVEEDLVRIWQDILGKEQIGVKDHFFELGGHSLKAIRLASQVYKVFEVNISLKELFSHPVLEDQAAWIARSQKIAFTAIPSAAEQAAYPLSSAQRRLWVLSQFEGGSVAYNMPGVFEFEGQLDMAALSGSFDTLIARHESLRTVFRETPEGEIKQYILSPAALDFRIAYHDLRGYSDATIKETIQAGIAQPFDLQKGPLLRAGLYQVADARWIFSYVMHHIVNDGWSMEVLIKEILQLYHAYVQGLPNPLAPLRIQYKDYAVWQQAQLNGAALNDHKTWWLKQLSGELPVLDLPADHIRPPVKTYRGGVVSTAITPSATAGLKALLRRQEATLFTGLLTLVKVLLHRYTGQEDLIIGSPVAGRDHVDLQDQIGFYVNTLALRTQLSGADSYTGLLEKVKAFTLQAYTHQLYPFDELLHELDLQRDMSRSALFDVMVVLQHQENSDAWPQHVNGLSVRAYEAEASSVSKFDLLFNFIEQEESIQLKITYNSDIYSPRTIAQLSLHLGQLLAAILLQPQQPVQHLDFLNAAEKHQLSVRFNDTARAYPTGKTIIDLFETQANKTPDAIALLAGDTCLSYRELQERSNQLAHYLLNHYYIKREDLVGVKLPRNEWLVITLLAVLKTGAAYVPIDINYPEERIAYIEQDSNCKLTITGAFLREFGKHISSGHLPDVGLHTNDLAYVIYTSGSTGQPKGVMITHSSVVTLLHWSEEEFRDTDFDILYAVTSHCFDLSVFEIFYPLTIGKKVRILENGPAIASCLPLDTGVLINTVPAVVNDLYNNGALFQHVAGINMAGEPIPLALSNGLLKHGLPLRNLYGPSEDTTYSTCYRITGWLEQSVPIGKPIANTQCYILSPAMALQPVQVTGELYLSGEGLSRGYLNREALTEERFIPNPYQPGKWMYRTGDLVRWLPDGNISFIGRKDAQVKIHGYRIELGEIEHALQEAAGVTNAVVLAKEHKGEKYIVAYLAGDHIDADMLKASLSRRLPHYMLPAAYVVLDKIPLTPNGKVDSKALLQLEVFKSGTTEYVEPLSEVEKRLAEIWKGILKLDKVGINDNFFELGGHSLSMISMLNRLKTEFGFEVKLEMFLHQPSIAALALHIENLQSLNTAGRHVNQQKIII